MKVTPISVLVALWLAATPVPLRAWPGDLDPTFGVAGKVRTDFGSDVRSHASAVIVQPDGRLVAVGRIEDRPSGLPLGFALARYNLDGTLDSTFGTGGTVTNAVGTRIPPPPGPASSLAFAVALQSDGKIVAAGGGGDAGHGSEGDQFALARYNPDGALDSTFGTGGTVTTSINSYGAIAFAVAVQPDGKLVAGGTTWTCFNESPECPRFAVARYMPDGSLDSTFGTGGTVTTNVGGCCHQLANALLLQADGKIVTVGTGDFDGPDHFALVRYSGDGSLDAGFGNGGIVRSAFLGRGNAGVLQPDGKLVAAGGAEIEDVQQALRITNFMLARYLPDGTLDPTFGSGGTVETALGTASTIYRSGFVSAVVRQPDGKLIAAGSAFTPGTRHWPVLRYNPDGSLDSTFAPCSGVLSAFGDDFSDAGAATIQPDGKLVVAGGASEDAILDGTFALARYGGAPGSGCRPASPGKALLVLNDFPPGGRRGNSRDTLRWRWSGDGPVAKSDFGDPVTSTDQMLCIVDAADGKAFNLGSVAPAGQTCAGEACWTATSAGYQYKDNAGYEFKGGGFPVKLKAVGPDGLTSVRLSATGDAGGKISVVGRGDRLGMPVLPLTTPLVVRLVPNDGSACWEATFSAPVRNGSGRFRAKSD